MANDGDDVSGGHGEPGVAPVVRGSGSGAIRPIDLPVFPLVRRGFDPDAVVAHISTLSEQIASLRAYAGGLEEREASLQSSLDEATRRAEILERRLQGELTELAASETEKLLGYARALAAETRLRAESDAAALLAATRSKAKSMWAETRRRCEARIAAAEDAVAEHRAAAEAASAEAERLHADARSRSDTTLYAAKGQASSLLADAELSLERARREADAVVERARAEAAEIVADAQTEADDVRREADESRLRVLGGLTERRSSLREQIRQLEAGRERLLLAYEVVRRNWEEAIAELDLSLPAARQEAHAALDRLLAAGSGEQVVAHEIERARGGGPGEPASGDAVDAVDAGGDSGEHGGADDDHAVTAAEASEAPPDPGPQDARVTGSMLAGWRSPLTRPLVGADGSVPAGPGARGGGDGEGSEPNPWWTAARHPGLTAPSPHPGSAAAGDATAQGAISTIDLVAALVQAPPVTVADGARPVVLDAAPAVPADPVEAARARCDAAVAEARRALRRRLKAALADDQNQALDALQKVSAGVPAAGEVLPEQDEHRKRYLDAARAGLAVAATTGRELAGALVPDGHAIDVTSEPPIAGDLADRLATDVVDLLRARLLLCFPPERMDSGQDRKLDRARRDEIQWTLRSAYRRAKGSRIERLINRASTEAVYRSLRDHLPAGVLPAGVDPLELFRPARD